MTQLNLYQRWKLRQFMNVISPLRVHLSLSHQRNCLIELFLLEKEVSSQLLGAFLQGIARVTSSREAEDIR